MCFLDIGLLDCQQLNLLVISASRLRECHMWWSVDEVTAVCGKEKKWHCIKVTLSMSIGRNLRAICL